MTDKTIATSLLVCAHCGTPNRVPEGKSLIAGKCGKCDAPLATQEPVDIDGDILNRLKARDTGAFVLDVWAPWCGPCRTMAPAYKSAAAKNAEHVRFFKLNSEDHQHAAASLLVRGIPTLIAWKGGKQIAHQPGAQAPDALNNWIRSTFGLLA